MRHHFTPALLLTATLAACAQSTAPVATTPLAQRVPHQSLLQRDFTLNVTVGSPKIGALSVGSAAAPEAAELRFDDGQRLQFMPDQFIVHVATPAQDANLRQYLRTHGGSVLDEGRIPIRADSHAPMNGIRSGEDKLVQLPVDNASGTDLRAALSAQGVTGNVRLNTPQAAATLTFAKQGFEALGLKAGLNVLMKPQGGTFSTTGTDGVFTDFGGSGAYAHRPLDLWWLGAQGVNALGAWSAGWQGNNVGLAVIEGRDLQTGQNPR